MEYNLIIIMFCVFVIRTTKDGSKMYKNLMLVGAIIINTNAFAQVEIDKKVNLKSAQVTVNKISDEYLKVAQETVMQISKEQALQSAKVLVQAQMTSDPSNIQLAKAYEAFYIEVFLSKEFYNGLVLIQMELFTYEELLKLRAMMQLPIFSLWENRLAQVLQRNRTLTRELVFEKQDRLFELIQNERERKKNL